MNYVAIIRKAFREEGFPDISIKDISSDLHRGWVISPRHAQFTRIVDGECKRVVCTVMVRRAELTQKTSAKDLLAVKVRDAVTSMRRLLSEHDKVAA